MTKSDCFISQFAESSQTLPLDSEIVYIANSETLLPTIGGDPDFDLALQLCLDSSRNAGRFLSVFFMGHRLRLPPLSNIPEENCASASICPVENQPLCNVLEYTCHEPGGGSTCTSFQIKQVAEDNQVTANVPIIDSALYYFRDQVLTTSIKGKLYVKDYYKLGKWVKKDLTMVLKYGAIFPKIYSVIDALQTGDGTEVLLNTDLANDILELIDDHRDVVNNEFQALLDRMEDDIELFRGKTKAEVLSTLVDP